MSFFSRLGQDMILPKDVLIQSKETNEVPGAVNATIGMATEDGKVMKINELESILSSLQSNEFLPYSPTSGLVKARELWKEKILKDNPDINKDYLSLPIATTGITQGIDVVANLFSEENDALILPHLFWQNYAQIYKIKLRNNIYKYDLFNDQKGFNIENFKDVLSSVKETKISILLNFPNNPTGYTPSTEEFEQLVTILKEFAENNKEKNIVLLADDAYFGLFFEGNHKNSTLNSFRNLVECDNILIAKLDGITKELYAWGLRLGFVTFYLKNDEIRNTIVEKAQGFLRSSTSSGSTFAQMLAIELLTNEKAQVEKLHNDKMIEERYVVLKETISSENLDELVNVLPFNSGYFFTIKLPVNINAHEFRLKLLNDYKYGVYSMDDHHIRIAFSCLSKCQVAEIIRNIKICLLSWK